jgi:hypothetical protein
MDYPDDLLVIRLVIASVFNLSSEDQCRRIYEALSNPYVRMLGHPTSRRGYCVHPNRVMPPLRSTTRCWRSTAVRTGCIGLALDAGRQTQGSVLWKNFRTSRLGPTWPKKQLERT